VNDADVMNFLKSELAKVETHFNEEIKKLRTGRAHPSMVEDVTAEAYGTSMQLKQLATITTPEPQLIQIAPFDPATISSIAQAIRQNQMLGFNPVDDGRVIRVQIPPLTTERRAQIVKQLNEKMEEAHIGIRKARHDAMDVVSHAKKEKTLGEDDAKRQQKQIDERVNNAKQAIERAAAQKEQEIMTV